MAGAATDAHLMKINEVFLSDFQKEFPSADVAILKKQLHEISRVFIVRDADGSGDMDMQELEGAVSDCSLTLNKAQLRAAVARVDDDESGTLRYREFINLILVERRILREPLIGSDYGTAQHSLAVLVGPRRGGRAKNGAVKKKKRGHLELMVDLKDTGKGWSLSCQIQQASSLLPHDLNGLADPYVKMYIQPDKAKKTKQKTRTVMKSLNPVWKEKFTWNFPAGARLEGLRLSVQVWDWDRIGRNDFMGAMAFHLPDLLDADTVKKGWFILMDEEHGATANFPVAGGSGGAPPEAIKRGQTKHGADGVGIGGRPAIKSALPPMKPSDFEYLKVLGRGSFGKVLLAQRKSDGKPVAIKVLKKQRVIEDDDVMATNTEKEILALPGECPFLIRMVASFQDPASLFFVMELVNGGDMMHHAMNLGAFSEKATTFYTAEIAYGLFYLHDKGIVYRDLKLDNVLMDNEGHVRIADFGLCKVGLAPGATTRTFCGTPNYLAPEVVQYKAYTKAVDWWSLGVVVYEMINGTVLFDSDREEELFGLICNQPISLPRTMSPAARQLVTGFLTRSYKKRLGFGPNERQDIMSQPIFKYLDWEKLAQKRIKPPLVPKVKSLTDTSNFDDEFTTMPTAITPTDARALKGIDQKLFDGFEYTSKF